MLVVLLVLALRWHCVIQVVVGSGELFIPRGLPQALSRTGCWERRSARGPPAAPAVSSLASIDMPTPILLVAIGLSSCAASTSCFFSGSYRKVVYISGESHGDGRRHALLEQAAELSLESIWARKVDILKSYLAPNVVMPSFWKPMPPIMPPAVETMVSVISTPAWTLSDRRLQ